MKIEDAYSILGLTQSASEIEVKKAYKRLALQTHPDKNPNDSQAHKQFLSISEAYKRITDPDSFKDDEDGGGMDEDDINMMFAHMFGMGMEGMRSHNMGSHHFHVSPEMFFFMDMMMHGFEDEDEQEYEYENIDDEDDDHDDYENDEDEYYEEDDEDEDGGDRYEDVDEDDIMHRIFHHTNRGSSSSSDGFDFLRASMGMGIHGITMDMDEEDFEGMLMQELLMGGGGISSRTGHGRRSNVKIPKSKASGGNKTSVKMTSSERKALNEELDKLAEEIEGPKKGKRQPLRQPLRQSSKQTASSTPKAKTTPSTQEMPTDEPLPPSPSKNKKKNKSNKKSKAKPLRSPSSSDQKAEKSTEKVVVIVDNEESDSDSSEEVKSQPVVGSSSSSSKSLGKKVSTDIIDELFSGRNSSSSSKMKKPLPSDYVPSYTTYSTNMNVGNKRETPSFSSSSSKPSSAPSSSSRKRPCVGDRVLAQNRYTGTVAFVGEVQYATGIFVGIVTDDSSVGKNNGTIKGTQYFKCQPGQKGLMVSELEVKII